MAEINLKQLMEARNPAQNIQIRSNDVITVPRADLFYVLGEVHKPGGFTLRDKEHVTVLQALSMSEGLLRTAGGKHARILRADSSEAHRKEIPVNVSKILSGQSPDVPMQPDDILFVPNSAPKSAALRGLEAAVQAGTGVAIWGRY